MVVLCILASMILLIIMMIAGGVITWTAGIGLERILDSEVATSLRFRFFVGIALSFAIGGSAHLKDRPSGISQNHGGWLAVLLIPGVLFAAPVFLLSPDWVGLSFVSVFWGILAGGCGHFFSRMLSLHLR